MSKQSNKPFYVDVGTSIVAIRCASNHDILWRRDHDWHGKGVIAEAERICARMNDEVAPAATGNVAALREALKHVNELNDLWFDTFTLPDGATSIHDEIENVISAALAAPPRNCDVGTAEEQEARFNGFCESHWDLNKPGSECAGCPTRRRKEARSDEERSGVRLAQGVQ